MNWTPEQSMAITLRDKNILVAAAAGSGKTAVLVERIKRLILEEMCPIDRMLIVTFTNAAAAEMKEKIRRALQGAVDELAASVATSEDAAGDGDAAGEQKEYKEKLDFLRQQLNSLPQAQISTFHAFALEVIRKYFYIIDVEPNFKICDEAQTTILKADAMDALMDARYEESDPEFLHFLDCYSGERNDNAVRDLIEKVYKTIEALPEPYVWLREKTEMLETAQYNGGESIRPMLDFIFEIAEENLSDAEVLIQDNIQVALENDMTEAAALAESDLSKIQALREHMGDYDDFRDALGALKFDIQKRGILKSFATTEEEVLKAERRAKIWKDKRDAAKNKLTDLKKGLFANDLEFMAQEMAQTSREMKMLESLVVEFGNRYRDEKKERGLMDFGDIEHYAYEILKDEEVSRYYREKFEHIFVDEYQDSNVMQEAFLGRVARENNLFLVGDVKQSIYKFRLAEPEIFQRRYKKYALGDQETSVKIDLNRNFRSKRPIINFVNNIFSYIMEDYDEAAALNMGDPNGDKYYHDPVLYLTDAEWDEDEIISDELKSMIKAEKEALAAVKIIRESLGKPFFDSKAGVERPLELKDIVILMRGVRRDGDIFYNVLMENGIPAYVDDNDGYFDTMEINNFLSLLMLLDNEKQDVQLLTVLRSEIFGFTITELAQIRIHSKEGSYYNAFVEYSKSGGDETLRKKSAAALSSIADWQSMAMFMPIEELIWKLMLDTGFYISMGAMPGGRQRQANLRALVDKALAYRKGERGSLYGFIRYIEALKTRNVPSGQVKLVGEGDELVKIMTVHKSKGLEFPMVILAGYCKGLKYSRVGSSAVMHKDFGVALPIVHPEKYLSLTTTFQKIITEKLHMEERAEEVRILYVALTRPKDRLVILGSHQGLDKVFENIDRFKKNYRSYFDMTGWYICTQLHRLQVFNDGDFISLITHRERSNEPILRLFDQDNHTGNDELAEKVRKQIEFRYPYQREMNIKSKYSVSELNALGEGDAAASRASLDAAAAPAGGIIGRWSLDSLKEPASFQKKEIFTAAQKGTIYHTLLEHIQFQTLYACADEEAEKAEVEATCQWLVDKQFLTEEEAEVLDADIVLKLIHTELGQRLAEAESENLLWKEQPFNLKMAYDPDGSGQPSDVFVQGVIDCYFQEEDGLVLVDYKTSRIRTNDGGNTLATEKKRIAQQYRTQIDIYRQALEESTGKTVKEAYIYLTNCGEVIEM